MQKTKVKIDAHQDLFGSDDDDTEPGVLTSIEGLVKDDIQSIQASVNDLQEK